MPREKFPSGKLVSSDYIPSNRLRFSGIIGGAITRILGVDGIKTIREMASMEFKEGTGGASCEINGDGCYRSTEWAFTVKDGVDENKFKFFDPLCR